jgi:hypothetical protein
MAWDICEACAMARAILAALDTNIILEDEVQLAGAMAFREDQIKAIARALGLEEDE